MHRFYVPQKTEGDTILISDTGQIHHIKDTLRLKVDDEVIVFDSEGNEYTCIITGLDKNQAGLKIKEKRRAENKTAKITVACAIPKKAKMDDIIDSLTQLGVDSIIPLETERVVVKLSSSKKNERHERWLKIAQSAAEQSQRTSIPLIEPITDLEGVLSRAHEFDLGLIPTLPGERKHLREVLAEAKPGNIIVLIGPEGDFTPQEIEMAKSAGFIPISLGDTVLRVSTAAIAVVSYIKFALAG